MEATLRFACLLAGLIAVQSQCLPSWTKVENSCYRAFGQLKTYDMASQHCKRFVGCDGISPGHLASPTSFEERRAIRKLRFDIIRPLGGNRIGEGQRLRPSNLWLGLRLGQGANTTWDSTEMYDNRRLDQYWGPNRPTIPGSPPQRQAFDPTNFRWNGRCMTLPGQMQMNGAVQKWGHIACNMQAAYMCEISPPGTYNQHVNTGGFNESTGMGPGMPGGGGRGWGQGGQGGQGGTGWGAGAGAGAGGRGQGTGGWGQGGRNPGQGAGQWPNNPQNPGQGGRNPGQGAGQWPNNPQNPGQGGRNPGQGAGQWPNNPQNPGQGGRNPGQGAGQWPNNPQNPGQGGRNPGQGAGQWPNNPQRPGAGGFPNNPQRPGQGGAGRWNPQNPQRPFNPQQPRMYQQGQAIAMP